MTLLGQAYRVWSVPQGLLSGKVPIIASPGEGGLVLRTRGVHTHDHLVVDVGRPYELVHFIVSACVATATREFYAAARGDEFEAWLANEHARAAASEPAQSRD